MVNRKPLIGIGIALACIAGLSCNQRNEEAALFKVLDARKTGLQFSNRLEPNARFNLFSYMYYYNGAGVGAGDFNNDGKVDLFFAANTLQSALYLNQGAMQFRDVTQASGIGQDSSWRTGVSVVDINQDGMLDIYVCKVGNYKSLRGRNSLWICQGIDSSGIPHYADLAAAYGLDFSGYSTQATFFDYDLDGDLDMFLLNHSVNHEGNYAPRSNFENTFDSLAGQRLFRNDSHTDPGGATRISFADVSAASGIRSTKIGYGLGVVVSDINLDGLPDIYVGNDFHENDYLYINQGKGIFRESGTDQLMHTSQFTMGVDAADVNNDALPDIISMDMLPYDSKMIRRSLAEDDYSIFSQKISFGYSYQYARNNLQYNRGGRFTELGQFAGVHATDWSWAALWMDFDNDGRKDLFVSNGIPKRMNDIDYINYVSGDALQQKLRDQSLQDRDLSLLSRFPEIKLPNQFFLNQGQFHFKKLSTQVGNNPLTFSNGAVYADLDNDGDLDIVVNNINDPALVYENQTNTADRQRDYARIRLKGSSMNPDAIGAKLIVFDSTEVLSYEQQPVRGFLSSMAGPMLIGLDHRSPDSALLIWPDNTYQRIDLGTRDLTVRYQPGLPRFDYALLQRRQEPSGPVWIDMTAAAGIDYQHKENRFNEFDRELLIPHMNSTEGPAMAVADINHDGLDDIYLGASKSYHGALYVQTPEGRFALKPQQDLLLDSMWEAVDAVWQDLNQDSHPDLLIATGGNEYYGSNAHQKPLLYLNDGKGNLSRKPDAFDSIFATQGSITTADINADGFTDVFIAGRVEPWHYGQATRSYLLQNDGRGKFKDVTRQYAPDLVSPGMVTHGRFADLNGDGLQDLVLSLLWGGIDAYIREGNRYRKQPLTTLNGWWQFVEAGDWDGDGDLDLIAGNFGLNSRLQPGPKQPVGLYLNDFDNNGKEETILTYYLGKAEIPFSGKPQLEKSLPGLKKKYLYAADFSTAGLEDIFGAKMIQQSRKLTADCFETMLFINDGQMRFTPKALPDQVQYSTVRTAQVLDLNHDEKPDILLGSNFYANHVEIGRMDGDFGTLLINKGKGAFDAETLRGIDLRGEVRRIKPIRIAGKQALILARNNDRVMVISPR